LRDCTRDGNTESAAPESARALRRLALAWFDATGFDAALPDWLRTAVLAVVPAVPPDLSVSAADRSPYQWLQIASCLDFAGDVDGARMLLDRIERSPAATDRSHAAHELVALICARRGRLARQLGHVEAASDWYRLGLARTDGARHLDAWSSCVQGLANCAQYLDDLQTAERLSRLVNLNHAVVPAYARVNALITLSVIHRKRGRVVAALRTAWQVHDLVPERDERRGTALVQIAQLALERGEPGAALRGFDVVLSFARTCRVRRPAQSGALAATLALWRAAPDASSRRATQTRMAALLAEVDRSDQPWERAHAHLDTIDALQEIGLTPQAERVAAAFEAELCALADRGTRLEWAERRLHTGRVAPETPNDGTCHTISRERMHCDAVMHTLSRLATLRTVHAVA
jgi:hypothetical protein